MPENAKRLYRSNKQKMIAGVCGGLAEYFNIDATIIRLAFVLGLFLGSLAFWVYIVMLIVIPEDPGYVDVTPRSSDEPPSAPEQ